MKTEYRGYTITYSENEEVFRCYDVGASHEKLSGVKRKIDAMHRKMRKENSFNCLEVSTYRGVSVYECQIVDYLGEERKKLSFQRVGTGEVIDHNVAYMSARTSHDGRQTRKTGLLSSLVLNTPDNLEKIEKVKGIKAAISDLEKEAAAISKSMASPSVDDIANLIAASEHTFSEGD